MISLLIVNYRTAALARDAILTARATTSAPLEVVVVDNSCDPREAGALRDVADILIASETNRGYAGGINAGRRACSAETIIVSNPDVTFSPHALDRLAEALAGNVSVAGPALFWDDAHEWRLPPGDLTTGPEKLDEVLASRSLQWRGARDRRRFAKRLAFWSATTTTPVRMLSGAILAIRAEAFDSVGGFDERFALYFEESDFLRRVRAERRRIAYVPDARCRHIYNQSAAQTGGVAAERYAASEREYLSKWNGPFFAGMVKRMERAAPEPVPALPLTGALEVDHPEAVVVEASPLSTFATAAGHFPVNDLVSVPAEVLRGVAGAALYVRVVERLTARVLGTYKITP